MSIECLCVLFAICPFKLVLSLIRKRLREHKSYIIHSTLKSSAVDLPADNMSIDGNEIFRPDLADNEVVVLHAKNFVGDMTWINTKTECFGRIEAYDIRKDFYNVPNFQCQENVPYTFSVEIRNYIQDFRATLFDQMATALHSNIASIMQNELVHSTVIVTLDKFENCKTCF